jgi:hypothetical protein
MLWTFLYKLYGLRTERYNDDERLTLILGSVLVLFNLQMASPSLLYRDLLALEGFDSAVYCINQML